MKSVTLAFLLSLLAAQLICTAQTSETARTGIPQAAIQIDFKGAVAPLLEKYCSDCHSGEKPKGDLNLEFSDRAQVEQRLSTDHKVFEKMADRLASGKMPPPKKAQPTAPHSMVVERNKPRFDTEGPL